MKRKKAPYRSDWAWDYGERDIDILRIKRDAWGVVTTKWTLARDNGAADFCRERLAWINAEIARRTGFADVAD